jgi:hypothetical protein
MNVEFDIRAVLPTVAVPTLVLHRTGDKAIAVEHGRYLADHLPSSKYVCRLAAMLFSAMAKFRAAWLWPARVSRDCPCFTSDRTSRPDDLFRFWKPTIPGCRHVNAASMQLMDTAASGDSRPTRLDHGTA